MEDLQKLLLFCSCLPLPSSSSYSPRINTKAHTHQPATKVPALFSLSSSIRSSRSHRHRNKNCDFDLLVLFDEKEEDKNSLQYYQAATGHSNGEELISDFIFIATYTIETTLPDGDIERVLANYISGSIAFSREEKEESRSFVPKTKRMKRMFSFFQQVSSMIKNGVTSDDDTTSCSSSRGTNTSCPVH